MKKNDESLLGKVMKSVADEGISGCVSRTKRYVKKRIKSGRPLKNAYKDILFISGCNEDLPHPWRYRVIHQREQLEAYHFSTDEIYFTEINNDLLLYYRAFVFFRCPYTDEIGKFVTEAKKLNKKIIYDIDDLVIDTKYTDLIPFVGNMNQEDKAAYDKNVMNMQRLLKEADFAVTTTNCLAEELAHYVPKVFINRNVASEEMVSLSGQAVAGREKRAENSPVRIGYFSGSITHNADFELILPTVLYILDKYSDVELYLMGELDLPDKLKAYSDRITKVPFGDWRKLPQIIANVDINLAPLEDTIFNRAKSENKWTEAALVKTVTVASDVGAFNDCIADGMNGVLCSSETEWKSALEKLIEDREYRELLAQNAFAYCMENCTTIGAGKVISQLFKREIDENYVFVLPGLELSGGMKVVFRHASMLQKSGKNVTLFTLSGKNRWYEYEGYRFPVISLESTGIEGNIGCAAATMWTTVEFVEKYPNITRRCYLVQNYETDFYKAGDPLRKRANQTYMPYNQVEFLTISKWCQNWLKDIYGQNSLYAPNGLEIERFACKKRSFDKKIRILIEGDCAVDYKNVDEAFAVVDLLDKEKYEIWYMSYNAEPKKTYHVDKFLHKVPYEKVAEVYEACDILLKTSLLESFSYPPLEMMASGGYVVVVPNGGNVEYLEDGRNCLFYPAGDIGKAKEQIERLCEDEVLRDRLFENGRKTAEARAWDRVESEILEIYSC